MTETADIYFLYDHFTKLMYWLFSEQLLQPQIFSWFYSEEILPAFSPFLPVVFSVAEAPHKRGG